MEQPKYVESNENGPQNEEQKLASLQNPMLEAALQYRKLGWSLFPVNWVSFNDGIAICSCQNGAKCNNKGKHPIVTLVEKGLSESTNDVEKIVSWWSEYPKANIGLNCQRSGIVVVDIDPRNGGDTDLEFAISSGKDPRSDVEAISGGKGLHYFFKATPNKSYPGKLSIPIDGEVKELAGIDLKHNGYVLLEPSIHQSGGRYSWDGSSDPRDGVVIPDAPSWMERVETDIGRGVGSKSEVILNRYDYGRVDEALRFVPGFDDYRQWTNIGIALRKYGQQGYALWSKWSQQSYQFDAAESVRKWNKFPVDAKTDESKIFAIAEENGWHNPSKRVETQAADVAAKTAEREKREEKLREEAQKTTDKIKEIAEAFPEAFSSPEFELYNYEPKKVTTNPFPVKELNDLEMWIDSCGDNTHPLVTQAAVLSILSCIAGRNYMLSDKSAASLSIIAGIPAHGNDDYAKKSVIEVLERVGRGDCIIEDPVNKPDLVQHVFDAPSPLVTLSHIGRNAKEMTRLSGKPLQHMHDAIMRIHGSASYQFSWLEIGSKGQAKGERRAKIMRPAMSIWGSANRTMLGYLLNSNEIGSTISGKSIYAYAVDSEQWVRKTEIVYSEPIPQHLIDFLDRIKLSVQEPIAGAVSAPESIQAIYDDGIRSNFIEQIRKLEMKSPKQYSPLIVQAYKNFDKLVTLLAAAENPHAPRVTAHMAEWAFAYISRYVNTIIDKGSSAIQLTSDSDISGAIMDLLDAAGADGLKLETLRDKCNLFRIMSKDERQSVLEQMKDDGLLVIVPKYTGKRGKPPVYYYSAKFIREKSTNKFNDD